MRLIDADKLKDELLPYVYTPKQIRHLLDKQPTVDMTPVHAQWWVQGDVYCCSNCHCSFRMDKVTNLWTVNNYEYCPMCGAKIEESEE